MVVHFVINALNMAAKSLYPFPVEKKQIFRKLNMLLEDLSQKGKLPSKLGNVNGIPFTFWLVENGLTDSALLIGQYFPYEFYRKDKSNRTILEFAIDNGCYQSAITLIEDSDHFLGFKDSLRLKSEYGRNVLKRLIFSGLCQDNQPLYLKLLSKLMHFSFFVPPSKDILREQDFLFLHKNITHSLRTLQHDKKEPTEEKIREPLMGMHGILQRYFPDCCKRVKDIEETAKRLRSMR